MNGQDIIEGINAIQAQYPGEHAQITTSVSEHGVWGCMARVGDRHSVAGKARGLEDAYGHGSTPQEAVADLIKEAGDRSPEATRLARIEKLRAELSKLEAVACDAGVCAPTPQGAAI